MCSVGFAAAADGAPRVPVAKITDFTGVVEVSSDGAQWRLLKRAKLLFAGYRVRTGANGTATVVSANSDKQVQMAARSVVVVESNQLRVVSGRATTPPRDSGILAFFDDLQHRFAARQRYTTVRRGSEDASQVLTPDHITAIIARPKITGARSA